MVCRKSVILKVYFSSFFSPGFAPYFRMSDNGKSGNKLFFLDQLSDCRYLNFVCAEIFIEYISMFHLTFFLILYFDWLLGPHKG